MKLHVVLTTLAAALAFVGGPAQSKERFRPCIPFDRPGGPRIFAYEGAADPQIFAPLFRIITLPERYDRKLVQTYGFLSDDEDHFYLYTSSEARRYQMYEQAVTVIAERAGARSAMLGQC